MPITSAKIEGKHLKCFAKKRLMLLPFAFGVNFRHSWVKRDLTVVVLRLIKSAITKDMSTNCPKGNVDKAVYLLKIFKPNFIAPFVPKDSRAGSSVA